jgi:hypothetical protein
MNLNKTLNDIKDLRIILGVLVVLFSIGLVCGYQLSPKPMIKALMCKNEINQIDTLDGQLTKLRLERLDDVSRVQKECISAQDKMCTKKIKKYREACLSLKCEICRASK